MNHFNADDLTFDETTFGGDVRLFPLPNLVLFPHVMQPLHIFEERYQELVQDALAGDRLITMTVLEPGWEPDYETRPPVAPIGCLGKIVTHCPLDDERCNLLLLGLRRVRIVRELSPLRSFRQAHVEVLDDCYSDDPHHDLGQLQQELLETFRNQLPASCGSADQLEELINRQIPLGPLTDLIAYSLPLALPVKQQLLTECRVESRAELLLQQLRATGLVTSSAPSGPTGFPPPFSSN